MHCEIFQSTIMKWHNSLNQSHRTNNLFENPYILNLSICIHIQSIPINKPSFLFMRKLMPLVKLGDQIPNLKGKPQNRCQRSLKDELLEENKSHCTISAKISLCSWFSSL